MRMRRALAISAVILLAMFAVSAWAWMQIPAGSEVPVHYGIGGEVDRYGGKFEALMLLPLISVGLVALFAFIPLIEPRRFNLERSRKAYTAMWLGVLALLLVGHIFSIFTVLGRASPRALIAVIRGALGVLIMVIGNYMGKVRSNFFFGIRTPWTLSSELSWSKTHRAGGRLFVLWGAAILASAFTDDIVTIYVLIAGAAILCLFVAVYSYLIWKKDADRGEKAPGPGERPEA